MKPVIIITIAVVFGLGLGLSLNVSAEEGLIPSWIKNTALWWGQGDISDDDFLGAMQFLIKEGILVIPSEQNEKTDSSQIEELKELVVTWNYKDILRNEDYYIGKIIYLTGEIKSTEKGEDGWVEYYVKHREDKWGYPDAEYFYVWHDGGRLLYGDMIDAYVMVDSIYEEKLIDWRYYPVVTARHLTCTSC